MADNLSWIKLEECIYQYIDQAELSNHKFYKLWNIGVRGLEDMGLDFFYQVKSVKLPVSSTKTVMLPADYLNYNKIGILNQKGEVIPMKFNNKLTTYASLLPGRLSKIRENSVLSDIECPIWYNYWTGSAYTNLYGLPSTSPDPGSFKIDIHNGVILLPPDFAYDYLMVEYTASPNQGEDLYLPVQFREPMIEWLAWKDIEHMPTSRKGSLGDKRDRRHDYFEARRKAQARYKPFHLEEAYIWSLENQRLTVKN